MFASLGMKLIGKINTETRMSTRGEYALTFELRCVAWALMSFIDCVSSTSCVSCCELHWCYGRDPKLVLWHFGVGLSKKAKSEVQCWMKWIGKIKLKQWCLPQVSTLQHVSCVVLHWIVWAVTVVTLWRKGKKRATDRMKFILTWCFCSITSSTTINGDINHSPLMWPCNSAITLRVLFR